jgi:ATP-dependent DNA helicase
MRSTHLRNRRIRNGSCSKFPQPALVTGARLKDYQLEGLDWMVSLDKNDVSGVFYPVQILGHAVAGEMGLGKVRYLMFLSH